MTLYNKWWMKAILFCHSHLLKSTVQKAWTRLRNNTGIIGFRPPRIKGESKPGRNLLEVQMLNNKVNSDRACRRRLSNDTISQLCRNVSRSSNSDRIRTRYQVDKIITFGIGGHRSIGTERNGCPAYWSLANTIPYNSIDKYSCLRL